MITKQYQELVGLLSDRAEVIDEIAEHTREKQAIETKISLLLDPDDPSIRIPGFGSVCISQPIVAMLFDPEALRELIQSLKETGHTEIAAEIEACQKKSGRAGGLRITPERHK